MRAELRTIGGSENERFVHELFGMPWPPRDVFVDGRKARWPDHAEIVDRLWARFDREQAVSRSRGGRAP